MVFQIFQLNQSFHFKICSAWTTPDLDCERKYLQTTLGSEVDMFAQVIALPNLFGRLGRRSPFAADLFLDFLLKCNDITYMWCD